MGYPKHPQAIFAFLLVIINSSATQVEPLQFLLGLPLTLPPPPITLPPTLLLLPPPPPRMIHHQRTEDQNLLFQ